MLAGIDIEEEIKSGCVFSDCNLSRYRIEGASIDLTIDLVYPRSILSSNSAVSDVRGCGKAWHSIAPGEMVIAETKEEFALACTLGGIVFPPNRLTKSGLIMTNPGHIDPGYTGRLTFCLINMGIRNCVITSADVIATLLLFDVSSPVEEPRIIVPGGIGVRQIEAIGDDFANLTQRTTSSIMIALNKRMALILALVAIVVTLVAAVAPIMSGYMAKYLDSGLTSRLDAVEQEVKLLKNYIDNPVFKESR